MTSISSDGNYKVIVQAESDFRDRQEDIRRLYVRSAAGEMVPLSTLVTIDTTLGTEVLRRYNMFRSASVSASPAPGFATGQAIGAIEGIATTAIPQGFGIQWTGTTFQELQAAGTTATIFVLAILFAYLFLVAQYESWSMPMAIILAVPVSLLGALLAVVATGTSVSIYTQIGLVMLIGLASKNAILIVEFAMQRRAEGATIAQAASEAASTRFRAVMMTALSFVLGILPLVVATGAGAVSRRALGSAILGGMLAAIVVGIILVPAMYFLLQNLRGAHQGQGGRRWQDGRQGCRRFAGSRAGNRDGGRRLTALNADTGIVPAHHVPVPEPASLRQAQASPRGQLAKGAAHGCLAEGGSGLHP